MQNDFEVSRSAIHGKGVFAKRVFAANSVLIRFGGPLIRVESQCPEDALKNPDAIGIAPGVWIPPPPFTFLNHSCEPNACLGKRGQLYSMRRIQASEEITIDYSTTECDRYWQMNCCCGSSTCRGVLLPIQSTFLDPSIPPAAPPGMLRALRRALSGA